MAARRPATKRRYPACFEFGCGQLRLGESFVDCLRRAYKDDFGVDIVLTEPLIPVTTYELRDEQEQRSIPGIIFFAEIPSPDTVLDSFAKEKHTEIRWVDVSALAAMAQECVPDFASTAGRAVELWRTSRSIR